MRAHELALVFRKGKKIRASFVSVWVYNKVHGSFRVAVICPKRVDKRAVRRNALRRRVREIARRDISSQLPKADLIIEIRPEAKNAPFRDLREDLHHVFHF